MYVVDEYEKLSGVLSLRSLVLAHNSTPVSKVMYDDEDEVASDISKYDLLALPVVDERDRLLGIVTFDDALDVVEEDNEETGLRQRVTWIVFIVLGVLLGLAAYTFILFQIIGYHPGA